MSTLVYPHISLDSDNVPMLTGTNTKVVEVVLAHLAHGFDADEIRRHYSYLTLGQIHSALAYYYDHREEVDRDITCRLHKVDEFQTRLGDSPIARKLKTLKARS
jgi:uncharacterized protein (DUF433 family)